MSTDGSKAHAADRLRIAMIMGGCGSGGMEKHTIELCSELARIGHGVTLLAHPSFASKVSPEVGFIPVDLARSRLDPRSLFSVWRHLRRLRPQIIHAQANKAAAMVASIRSWLPPCVTVATLHNEKRQIMMFRRFDARIAVSRLSADLLSPWPARVIYNGIDPTPAPTPDTSVWDGLQRGTRVLAVGRLVPAKAFDNLILAWRTIQAPLVIAGAGGLQDALQEQIDRFGLADRVRLLGHRDDVAALMHSAELLVISSRNEGNPYVMVEALHARLPVISTAVGAIPEILPENALCPRGDVTSLQQRVETALADLPRFRESLGPVFERAGKDMSLSGMTEKTVEVYRAALRDRGAQL